MARREKTQPPLITSARFGQSLDTSQRTRRYVITMAFRVVCFVSGMLAPMPWSIVLLLAAAFLPGVAVLLANAVDRRTPPAPIEQQPVARLELTAGDVVRGEVEEDES